MPVVKYGGSALWVVLVYMLALVAWPRLPGQACRACSVAVSVLVGASRLGRRVFSLWNIVAYAIGIGVAAAVHARWRRSPSA